MLPPISKFRLEQGERKLLQPVIRDIEELYLRNAKNKAVANSDIDISDSKPRPGSLVLDFYLPYAVTHASLLLASQPSLFRPFLCFLPEIFPVVAVL